MLKKMQGTGISIDLSRAQPVIRIDDQTFTPEQLGRAQAALGVLATSGDTREASAILRGRS